MLVKKLTLSMSLSKGSMIAMAHAEIIKMIEERQYFTRPAERKNFFFKKKRIKVKYMRLLNHNKKNKKKNYSNNKNESYETDEKKNVVHSTQ